MEVRALVRAIFLVPLGPCKKGYAASHDVCLCKYRNVQPKKEKNTPKRSSFKPQAADTHISNGMMRTGTVISLAEVVRVRSRRHSRVTAREL